MLLNPERMRAVYAMLLEFPPFDRWTLPPPDEVEFELLADRDHAEYNKDDDDKISIAVNPDTHLTLQQIIESMAHEMVHVRQDQVGRLPDIAERHHNAEFRKLARLVCKTLGFDVQKF